MGEAITQKHDMACGLACVCYVANEPYDNLASKQSDERLNIAGFCCPELVELLNGLGQRYAWKKLSESERDSEFSIGDIVFVEPSSYLPYGHFLAKTEDGWMDPWINLNPEDPDVSKARAGIRETLPGRAEYLVFPL